MYDELMSEFSQHMMFRIIDHCLLELDFKSLSRSLFLRWYIG